MCCNYLPSITSKNYRKEKTKEVNKTIRKIKSAFGVNLSNFKEAYINDPNFSCTIISEVEGPIHHHKATITYYGTIKHFDSRHK